MNIGFVGLGEMGRPMALNLARAGYPMTVCDLREEVLEPFRQMGVHAVSNVALLKHCDVVFSSLPDDRAVEAVFLGEGGLLKQLGRGAAWVDLSTIKYGTAVELERHSRECGVRFMDAPVSGMQSRAVDGTLAIMCGGERTLFQAVEPLLRHMGEAVRHLGDCGSGQLMKLLNNLLFDMNMAALAEILPIAAYMGLDPETAAEIINRGTGGSFASAFFSPHILEGTFEPGYPMEKAYKDLQSGSELAMEQAIPHPMLAATISIYQTALQKSYGHFGKGAMVRPLEELLGVEFRSREGTAAVDELE